MVPRQSELRDYDIYHAREQVIFVANMVIEGHSLDADALAQLPHGQRLDAVLIGQRNCGSENDVSRKRSCFSHAYTVSLQCKSVKEATAN
jgi:hypothetical protein